MSFPRTSLTLIQRLASGGSEDDWQGFLGDYWGPTCRFSLRWGARGLNDAEEVASQTFEVLWEKRLLVRWISNRSAKLRTLICCVVRNILSDRHRTQAGRDRLARDLARRADELNERTEGRADAFYAAWVEDLLQRSVEAIAADYCRESKDDYVRVLYGRLCERLTIAEVADALTLKPATVVNYFRHARQRLAEKLEQMVRMQIHRYCLSEEAESEFGLEWQQLGEYLAEHGGLEEAVRNAYELLDPVRVTKHQKAGLSKAATRLTATIRASSGETPSSGRP